MTGKEAAFWSVFSMSGAAVLCCLIVSVRGCSEAQYESERAVKEAAVKAAENGAIVIDLKQRP